MIGHDNSVRDQRHLQEIENAILHDGNKPELIAWFIDHAVRDHKAENELKERIKAGSDEVARPFWKKVPYIQKHYRGQTDSIARAATDEDRRQFASEWQAYVDNQNGTKKHSIKLLPGNNVCVQAVFDELGLTTIEDFISHMETHPNLLDIFSELQPLHETAKRWRTFMKPRLKLVDGALQED